MRESTAVIVYRLDQHIVQEQPTILAVIAQQRASCGPGLHGTTQPFTSRLIAITALQTTQVGSQQLRCGVASELLEVVVDVHHRLLTTAGLADHDTLRRLVEYATNEIGTPTDHVKTPRVADRAMSPQETARTTRPSGQAAVNANAGCGSPSVMREPDCAPDPIRKHRRSSH